VFFGCIVEMIFFSYGISNIEKRKPPPRSSSRSGGWMIVGLPMSFRSSKSTQSASLAHAVDGPPRSGNALVAGRDLRYAGEYSA
jgi:hypothetical protein